MIMVPSGANKRENNEKAGLRSGKMFQNMVCKNDVKTVIGQGFEQRIFIKNVDP